MKSERLEIRRFAPADWEDVFHYLSDESVVRFEPYPPQSEQQCREAAQNMAGSADFWAVCLPGGAVIGQVYLAEKPQANWELGYVFARAHQHRGYATEAAARLVRYAFTEKQAHRLFAHCNPQNTASWRLLQRLAFRREAHLLQNVYFSCDEDCRPLWQDTYEYALLAGEWGRQAAPHP